MNTELIDYYVNLLILQYRSRSNARGTILSIIESLMIYDLIREVENGYNVDDAIGVQLDILAKYVGANRTVTAIDFSRTFFSFVEYAEPEPFVNVAGMLEYSEVNPPDAQFLTYKEGQESRLTLTNAELRLIIKLKIIQNNSNHSTFEIDEFLEGFFPDQVIFNDNFNMTISYLFDAEIRRIVEIALSEGAIPKPAAVGLIIDFAEDINNIFAMQKYDFDTPVPYAQGMIEYSQDPFGSFLIY